MTDTDRYPQPADREAGPLDGDWLSIGEAAKALGLSVQTVRRYSDSNRLPAYRSPGGQRRFRRSDIDRALTAS